MMKQEIYIKKRQAFSSLLLLPLSALGVPTNNRSSEQNFFQFLLS
jgi:hypothetical protein